ncbi:MAG: VCBS repeat-containing protein [Bacteroidetes bacterium]|nr:VCBS repeat-containing protein [Bacteroidota bacterium]
MKYFSTFSFLFFLIVSFLMPAQQITFSDVAGSMGINHPFSFIRGSVSFCDFNGDGKDDLSFSSIEGLPMFIYRNDETWFTDVTNELGLVDSSRTMILLWSDYDNDGDKDLFTAVNSASSYSRLYRNDGWGVLKDVTLQAGLTDLPGSCNAACWGDFNNDGWIDLYVTNYREFDHNYLYMNNGDGTFTDVTEDAGVADTLRTTGNYKLPFAVIFFDYNNDGWQDIYIANDHFSGNTLFENNGDGTFEDVSEQTYSAMGGNMMGIAVGDYDNNGFLDLYLSNDPFGNFLLKNNGDETFTEVAVDLDVTVNKACWGTNFFDYDNDTDLDLYVCASVGSPNGINEFFENNGDGTFQRMKGIGLDNDYKSFGMSIGDFNNDGFYDIAVNNQQVLPNLFMNSSNANNWVKLNLVGVESNRDGIGSWIEVYNNGSMFIRETHCGISYMSQNSSSLIIGAGEETAIDSIIIKWAGSGNIDILRNVAVNQTITVEEGSTITSVEYEEFVPAEFVLEQNYPNPFNPSTTIKFNLTENSYVTLNIFNVLGEEIAILINNDLSEGRYEVNFDALNFNSGVYFYRLTAYGYNGIKLTSVKKMILSK